MKKIIVLFVCVISFSVALAGSNKKVQLLDASTAKQMLSEKSLVVGHITAYSPSQAYMNIYEHNNIRNVIVAAYSPIAAQVQLHTLTAGEMKQVSQIDLKQHTKDTLQSGGYHVMFMGLTKPLKSGLVLPVIFIFADGSWLQVNAIVTK